jgi:hypothetical protein
VRESQAIWAMARTSTYRFEDGCVAGFSGPPVSRQQRELISLSRNGVRLALPKSLD